MFQFSNRSHLLLLLLAAFLNRFASSSDSPRRTTLFSNHSLQLYHIDSQLFTLHQQLTSISRLCASSPLNVDQMFDDSRQLWHIGNASRRIYHTKMETCMYLIDSNRLSLRNSNVLAGGIAPLAKQQPFLRIAALTMSNNTNRCIDFFSTQTFTFLKTIGRFKRGRADERDLLHVRRLAVGVAVSNDTIWTLVFRAAGGIGVDSRPMVRWFGRSVCDAQHDAAGSARAASGANRLVHRSMAHNNVAAVRIERIAALCYAGETPLQSTQFGRESLGQTASSLAERNARSS
jgi:hypothetical protein